MIVEDEQLKDVIETKLVSLSLLGGLVSFVTLHEMVSADSDSVRNAMLVTFLFFFSQGAAASMTSILWVS